MSVNGLSPARRDLSELLRLAAPVVGTRLGIMAMAVTDTIVVGRHSATELGFMALGWAPVAVVLTTAIGMLTGVQVLTARRVGAGRPDLTGAVLRRGVVYAVWIGVAGAAMLALLGPAFLSAVGVEPGLAEGAGRVLVIYALSLAPALVATAGSSYLEALSRPGAALAAMWFANVVNLALDLVLVPGAFGLPALGAAGAAWATMGARVGLMLFLFAYLAGLRDAKALGVFARPRPEPRAAIEQRRIGYAAGAAIFFETAAFSAMSIVAGWVGGLAVAGWAVVLNVTAVIFMVPLGVSVAASVLVARAHGADDRAGVARAGGVAFGLTALIGLAATLVVWPGAELIAGLYTTDPALVALAAGALALACLFFIADGLQVVGAQMLRSRGDVWAPTAVQFACFGGLMLPLAWALAVPGGMGLAGIVWAVVAASLLSASLLVWRFWALSGR